jgi:tetratricopeptide (TPR) repeat protein
VATYPRIRRQQLIREAEGYLDLVTVFDGRWSLEVAVRDRVAQRALDVLARLEGADAERSEVLQLRGQALRVMERYTDAVKPLRASLAIAPDDIATYLALGWCYKRLGRVDLAIEALEEALEVDRAQGILYYNLACYWSLARNVDLALMYLAQALEIEPAFRDLVADERDFDAVRAHPDFLALTSVVV